jgi:hypothetical protein
MVVLEHAAFQMTDGRGPSCRVEHGAFRTTARRAFRSHVERSAFQMTGGGCRWLVDRTVHRSPGTTRDPWEWRTTTPRTRRVSVADDDATHELADDGRRRRVAGRRHPPARGMRVGCAADAAPWKCPRDALPCRLHAPPGSDLATDLSWTRPYCAISSSVGIGPRRIRPQRAPVRSVAPTRSGCPAARSRPARRASAAEPALPNCGTRAAEPALSNPRCRTAEPALQNPPCRTRAAAPDPRAAPQSGRMLRKQSEQ